MQAVPGWLCSPPPPALHWRRSLRPPAGRPSLVQNRLISTTSAVEICGARERVRKENTSHRYDNARHNQREEPSAWHGSIPLIHGRPFDRSPISCATASSAETCGRVACCRRKPSCLPSSAPHDRPSV